MGAPYPTCSVLIPAYNVENYVAEAIESALSQTYPAVEVVVVNDGSTDSTAEVIGRYRDRIVYVDQGNKGLAGARNAALSVASGSLIGLLDADDAWLPHRAARCAGLLVDRPKVGFVTTDAWLLEDDKPTSRRFYGDLIANDFPEHNQLARMMRSNMFFVSVVARRELYDRHGGFDESVRRSGAEDYDLWLRFLAGGETAACIREPLAYYRLRGNSLSADKPAQADAHRDVLEKHLPWLAPLAGSGFAYAAWELALRCADRGDARAASRFFLLAAHDSDLSPIARARALRRAALARTRGR